MKTFAIPKLFEKLGIKISFYFDITIPNVFSVVIFQIIAVLFFIRKNTDSSFLTGFNIISL